jgi:galactokinase
MDTKPLKAQPPEGLAESFKATFNDEPEFLVRAPGCVSLVGGYAEDGEGWELAAAISRHVWAAARELPTTLVSLHAFDLNQQTAFRLTDLEEKKAIIGRPLPEWAQYAAGVAWNMQNAGIATPGSQVTVTGEMPMGAGLYSSAALEVAYGMAWAQIVGWEVDRMLLARLCQHAEVTYVGVESGLVGQFASLHGKAGHVLLFNNQTREWDALPLPGDYTLVLADTGVRDKQAKARHRQRLEDCAEAIERLKEHLPDMNTLQDVDEDQFDRLKVHLPDAICSVAEHIIKENRRALAAAVALKAGDMEAFGKFMDDSYVSSRELFQSTSPALESMWEAALEHPSRVGGRLVGSGGAGSMIFLVESGATDEFAGYLSQRYSEQAGVTPSMTVLRTVDGAEVLPVPSYS